VALETVIHNGFNVAAANADIGKLEITHAGQLDADAAAAAP
jgi:hypothetical protein